MCCMYEWLHGHMYVPAHRGPRLIHESSFIVFHHINWGKACQSNPELANIAGVTELVVWMIQITIEAEEEIRWEWLLGCAYRIFPATHLPLGDLHPSILQASQRVPLHQGRWIPMHKPIEAFTIQTISNTKSLALILYCNFVQNNLGWNWWRGYALLHKCIIITEWKVK